MSAPRFAGPGPYKVMYDFHAQSPSEISLKGGEVVQVEELSARGWCRCIAHSKSGYAPLSFLAPCFSAPPASSSGSAAPPAAPSSNNPSPALAALYSPKGGSFFGAAGRQSSQSIISAPVASGGGGGRPLSGTGQLPPGAAAPSVPAIALFQFEGQEPNELSFKQNDHLLVTPGQPGNWWLASLNGVHGYVPANYVKITGSSLSSAPAAPSPSGASSSASASASAASSGSRRTSFLGSVGSKKSIFSKAGYAKVSDNHHEEDAPINVNAASVQPPRVSASTPSIPPPLPSSASSLATLPANPVKNSVEDLAAQALAMGFSEHAVHAVYKANKGKKDWTLNGFIDAVLIYEDSNPVPVVASTAKPPSSPPSSSSLSSSSSASSSSSSPAAPPPPPAGSSPPSSVIPPPPPLLASASFSASRSASSHSNPSPFAATSASRSSIDVFDELYGKSPKSATLTPTEASSGAAPSQPKTANNRGLANMDDIFDSSFSSSSIPTASSSAFAQAASGSAPSSAPLTESNSASSLNPFSNPFNPFAAFANDPAPALAPASGSSSALLSPLLLAFPSASEASSPGESTVVNGGASPLAAAASPSGQSPTKSDAPAASPLPPPPESDAPVALLDELKQLRRQIEELRDRETCIICMEAAIQFAFIPCGHYVCCDENKCASDVVGKNCPVCRQHVERMQRIFKAT